MLTLHVAVGLGHGYGAAGTAGAVVTIGMAVGASVMGRLIDRFGLRLVLVITMVGEALFWGLGSQLSYPALLVAGFAGGLLQLPAMSIGRQAIAALVPRGPAAHGVLDGLGVDGAVVHGRARRPRC